MRKTKALVLFSGGLDSVLTIKILLNQKINVEAVYFVTPFSTVNKNRIKEMCKELKVKLHEITLKRSYLNLIKNPKHGYGSQMNPCIDCRIFMLKKAARLAKKIKADFIATGEVLGERPFSQRMDSLLLIEKESGLKGKILRPLSARLLPITDAEKNNLVDRNKLFAIKGRSRKPQLKLAKKFKIKNFLSPAGGCLLTDPRFADRLRDFLKFNKKLTLLDVELLKLGRHFRVGRNKIIVGRNEEENKKLLQLAKKYKIPFLEDINYPGPITLLLGKTKKESIKIAAEITAHYSDAKGKTKILYKMKDKKILEVIPISRLRLKKFIV